MSDEVSTQEEKIAPSKSADDSIQHDDNKVKAPASHARQEHAALRGHGHAGNHAHHLKYGEIQFSGYAPPSINDDEEEDDDANVGNACRRSFPDRDERRRRMNRDRSMEALDAEARRIHAQRRYLFRRPRALQYFRGNMLVRTDEERSSGRLELFFDLTFVGIIAVLAEEAVAEPTGASLVRYIITYTAAYNVWNSLKEVFNAFYNDDLSQKILVLAVMCCLVIYGNNAPRVEQNLSEGSARAAAVGSYLLAEFLLFSTFFYYSFHIKSYRAQLRIHTGIFLISAGIYIGCIFVDVKSAIAMAVVALVIEVFGWPIAYSGALKKFLRLRYSSAINIEHEIERFNDFYTLVIGEFIFSLFAGSPIGNGVHVAAARAVLAVIIAFCFQLFYMKGACSKRITHPLRQSWISGLIFFLLHIPLVSALTLCGDSMAELVRDSHVSQALRWYACETYAVGMIANWCLAQVEFERDEKGELWFPKWARLAPRLIVGFIAIFLPFTHQHEEGASEEEVQSGIDITTTALLGILAGMSAFALLWELVTALDGPNAPQEVAHDSFLEKANDGHTTRAALSTIPWRGYPAFVEPGAGTFDNTHQRDHHVHVESDLQQSES